MRARPWAMLIVPDAATAGVGTRRLDDSLPSDLNDVGELHLSGAPPFLQASSAGKQKPSPTEAALTTILGSKPSPKRPITSTNGELSLARPTWNQN